MADDPALAGEAFFYEFMVLACLMRAEGEEDEA